MQLDREQRRRTRRTLARYQCMFRSAVAGIGVGGVLLAASIIAWLVPSFTPVPEIGFWSVVVISLSGLLAYKVATSTVRILEAEGCFGKR